MGRLRNGILGNIRGKVANVVGTQVRQTNVLRGYAIPSNPRTPRQVEHRNLHAQAMAAIRLPYNQITKELMRGFDRRISGINALMSQTMRLSVANDNSLLPFITLSRTRNRVISITASAGTGNTINYAPTFTNVATATEPAMFTLVALNTTRQEMVSQEHKWTTSPGSQPSISRPASWKTGEEVIVYIYGKTVEEAKSNDEIMTSFAVKITL